jgi:superfamily II DNA or RNA helicase
MKIDDFIKDIVNEYNYDQAEADLNENIGTNNEKKKHKKRNSNTKNTNDSKCQNSKGIKDLNIEISQYNNQNLGSAENKNYEEYYEGYALENNLKIIKPVLLVVAKDTNHASELKNLIDSDNFRTGEFKGKVLEIHTKVKGEEAEENIEQLISLEDEGNLMEVVIHVNMLKEGWDVANVYTIAPLRQSAAAILTEQTIGRGLRLPYGERTGNELVDKLVIVAHEQYSKILEMAKDSVLIKGQIEQINPQEIGEKKILIQSLPIVLKEVANEIEKSAAIMAEIAIEVKKEVLKNPQNANFSEEKQQEIIAKKTEDKVLDWARKIISHDQQTVKNLAMIIEDNIYTIAEDIHKQISKKVEFKSPSYLATEIGKPKPVLEQHNIVIIP